MDFALLHPMLDTMLLHIHVARHAFNELALRVFARLPLVPYTPVLALERDGGPFCRGLHLVLTTTVGTLCSVTAGDSFPIFI